MRRLLPLILVLASPATALAAHPVRNAARFYVTHPVQANQRDHVSRCHRVRAHERSCTVRFTDDSALLDNGQAVVVFYRGRVLVRKTPGAYRCTFDPSAFAWTRC